MRTGVHPLYIVGAALGLVAIVEVVAGCATTVQRPQVVLPTNAPKIRSDYGDIWGFGGVRSTPHLGIDFLEGIGALVLAVADGVVVRADYRHVGGYVVILDHGEDVDGNYLGTIYAHNSENLVRVGEKVKRGQPIAKLGATGQGSMSAPHLHFQMYKSEKPIKHSHGFNYNPYHHNPHEYWAESPCYDRARNYEQLPIRFIIPIECKL